MQGEVLDRKEALKSCPHCGCGEFFVRKDFPQKLGLAVVIASAVGFLVLAARRSGMMLGLGLLAAATVVDALLYLVVGKVTVCYRCRAEFRKEPISPEHGPFELAIAEKYRKWE
jgi:hypothetical protein